MYHEIIRRFISVWFYVCLFILFVITCFISVSRGIKRASQTPVHVTIRQFETDKRKLTTKASLWDVA